MPTEYEVYITQKVLSCQENVQLQAKAHFLRTTFRMQTTKQKEDSFQTLDP